MLNDQRPSQPNANVIKTKCEHCGTRIKVKRRAAGYVIACPKCEKHILVPLPIVAVAEATLIDDVGPQPSPPPFRDKPPIAKFAIDPPPVPQLPTALPPVENLPPAPQIPANGQPIQIHYHIYNVPPATPPLVNPSPAPNINVNVSPVISVGARSDSYANADADNYIDDDKKRPRGSGCITHARGLAGGVVAPA